ncbi:MAG TPA: hypothetical protein ENJ90_02745 [Devosia sp.]|nr:hypothetical protein [Devosia sp.]
MVIVLPASAADIYLVVFIDRGIRVSTAIPGKLSPMAVMAPATAIFTKRGSFSTKAGSSSGGNPLTHLPRLAEENNIKEALINSVVRGEPVEP